MHTETHKMSTHTNMRLVPGHYSIHCGWPLHPPLSATAAVRRWCRAAQYGMWAPTMAAVCGHHAVTDSSPTRTPFCSNCCAICLVVCSWGPGSPSGPWKRRRLVHSVACKHITMKCTRESRSWEGGLQTWSVMLSHIYIPLGLGNYFWEWEWWTKNCGVSWTNVILLSC